MSGTKELKVVKKRKLVYWLWAPKVKIEKRLVCVFWVAELAISAKMPGRPPWAYNTCGLKSAGNEGVAPWSGWLRASQAGPPARHWWGSILGVSDHTPRVKWTRWKPDKWGDGVIWGRGAYSDDSGRPLSPVTGSCLTHNFTASVCCHVKMSMKAGTGNGREAICGPSAEMWRCLRLCLEPGRPEEGYWVCGL